MHVCIFEIAGSFFCPTFERTRLDPECAGGKVDQGLISEETFRLGADRVGVPRLVLFCLSSWRFLLLDPVFESWTQIHLIPYPLCK